jgi:hypothetical protein
VATQSTSIFLVLVHLAQRLGDDAHVALADVLLRLLAAGEGGERIAEEDDAVAVFQ